MIKKLIILSTSLRDVAEAIPKNEIASLRSQRRIIALIFIVIISCTFLCPSYAADKIILKVAYLPNREARDPDSKAALAIVERFQELHPNIKLEPFMGLSGPWGGGPMDPLLAIAGGVAPHVMYVNFRNSGTYIQQGFLYPLDEYVEEWKKEFPEEVNKAIYPAVWPVIKRKGPDGKVHIWSMPFGGALVKALIYRKDLFKKAGLDPEKYPINWDEFYKYCKKLTDHEKGTYGVAFHAGSDCSYWFVDFLWCAGADVLAEDEKGEWHAVFNTPEAVTALEFYRKLIRDKWIKDGKEVRGVAYRGSDMYLKWARGEIGMTFTYLNANTSGGVQWANPNLYGIAPVPLGPTGIRGNELNQMMYGINATIKDKKVRDAAWKYIKFLNSKEARQINTKIMVENGYAKFVNPGFLREFGYEKYIKEIPAEWEKILNEALIAGKPEPYGKNSQLIYQEMDPACEAVAYSDTVSAKEVLDKAVVHCNEKMLKNIPIEKLKKRRKVGGIVLGIMAITFGFLFYRVLTSFTSMHKEAHPDKKRKKYIYAWMIMLPALIGVALWQYYPLLRGSIMGFQDYKLTLGSTWVGIDNFVEVLYTSLFWKSLLNSCVYALLALVLGFPAPIILALLLHEVPKGKVFFRVLYYLPAVTTGIVIMLLWKGFFEPNPNGLFNKIIAIFGIPAQTWFNDPKLAMLCVIMPLIWSSIGPGCIIYLAALKSIPEELYDAADIDGTGTFSKVRFIVLPYLKPLIVINFVGAFIGAFRSFDFIFVMTGGGPLYATHVVGLEIWYQAFMQQHFGYATAMAWILGSLLVGFTVYQLKFLSKLQFKTTA